MSDQVFAFNASAAPVKWVQAKYLLFSEALDLYKSAARYEVLRLRAAAAQSCLQFRWFVDSVDQFA